MPFIGNQPADKFLTLEKQVFTTSATDTYVLDREVSSPNDLELFLNNVRQEPVEAYSCSGTTLTLASAITASDSMYCIYQGRAVGTQSPAVGSVTNGMLQNSSITLNGSAVSLGGSANTGFESQLFHVRDEKGSGSHAGASSAGTQTRTINTVKTNEITGASLSSNQITLPAGTYYVHASTPAFRTRAHQIYFYSVTDGSNEIIGENEYSDESADGSGSRSNLSARFTTAIQKVYEIRHYTNLAVGTQGLGIACSNSTEVYTDVKIWKIA